MSGKQWWNVLEQLTNKAHTHADSELLSKNLTKIIPIIKQDTNLCKVTLDGDIPKAFRILRGYFDPDPSARAASNEQEHDEVFYNALRRTQDAWMVSFIGDTETIFHAAVCQEAAKFEGSHDKTTNVDYYAKVMPVTFQDGVIYHDREIDHFAWQPCTKSKFGNRPQRPWDCRLAMTGYS